MSPASFLPSLSLRRLCDCTHAWRLRHANVEFALLGMLATALALYAGMLLELKAPYTAAASVWVVANTRPGHVISKSTYRVLGTLCGAAFAVAAVACFDSMPVVLFAALAVWVGICTALGNLLRHFRGYFGLLAGYTAAFIMLGAYDHPDRVLDYALDRTSAVVIGVLSMSVVVVVLGVRRTPREIIAVLEKIQSECLHAITSRWDKSPEEVTAARLALSADFARAEASLEYADLESPGFRRRIHRLRVETGMLLDGVDASRLSASRINQNNGLREKIVDLYAKAAWVLQPMVEDDDSAALALAQVRAQMVMEEARLAFANALTTSERESLAPLVDWLERWKPRMNQETLETLPLKEPFRGEPVQALRQGIRATAAIFVSAAFWIFTGWQSGAAFLINGSAFCALASTMSHPVKGVMLFAQATAVSVVAGFLCKFFLLPQAEGFGEMVGCLAIVLVPIGCLAFSRSPLLDGIGVTSGLFLLALVQPSNHMTYDPAQYLSSGLATVFSGLILVPVYATVLPLPPAGQAEAVLKSFRRRARYLASRRKTDSLATWRLSAHHQMLRLQGCQMVREEELEEGLRLLDRGTAVLGLRELCQDSVTVNELFRPALEIVSRRQSPAKALEALLHALPDPAQLLSFEPELRARLSILSECLVASFTPRIQPQP